MMKDKSWIVTLETDPETGEFILPLNDEILEGANLKVGDTIEWIDNKDGSWTMKKKEVEWVLVECVSTFRQRYVVQVPAGKEEWALDTVSMEEAKEFSQKHLGETIVSHRVITQEDAIKLCDEDNGYVSAWPEEKKIETFFTKVED
jgi:hypothetical protein